ncbi:MAG: pro-sigmaK processing inhibitor BofA family protein [Clostridia bacterium]|nr:pro-sigmaK processing inhibitor BofA family protein [Clostridia bacterium]
MNFSVILPFIGAVLVVFVVLKLLSAPLKLIIKLVLNGVIGGLIIFLINWIGAGFGFTLPLEWWSAILVGLLGVPGVIILVILHFFI